MAINKIVIAGGAGTMGMGIAQVFILRLARPSSSATS